MGQWVKITYILSRTLNARGQKGYLGVAGQAIYFNLVSRWPQENYVPYDVIRPHWVNSLLNGDALWWHKFWSNVPQVISITNGEGSAFRFFVIITVMGAIASQITSLSIVYSIFHSGADQRKHQCSVSLAFVWGIHRGRWISRTNGQ